MVPDGFAAYCPISILPKSTFTCPSLSHHLIGAQNAGRRMRQTENGWVAHPEMQFHAINSGPASSRWRDAGFPLWTSDGDAPRRERATGGPEAARVDSYRSYGLYGGDIDVAMATWTPQSTTPPISGGQMTNLGSWRRKSTTRGRRSAAHRT